MSLARTIGSTLQKLAVVVFSVLLALIITLPLAPRMVHSRDLLFIAAVILVSRYQGMLSGVAVALLSVLAFDWYFDQTPGVLDFTLGNALRIVVFIAVSLLITLLDRQRRRAMQNLADVNSKLQKALDEVRTLRGILPICSYCKKVMSGPETWIEVENYVRAHTEVNFSHGVCPECMRKYFSDISRRQ